MGDTLSKEVKAWGTLAILIVIISLVLIKFKIANPGNITCASGYTFNATANNCYLTTNASQTASIGTVGGTIDTFVTSLSEPKNWVIIAIIALIGFAILKYFQKKGN
ncbi:MAG TPA: hypothetical protein PLG47_05235 [Candidatus Dojkabacteria bacterium]|nr:hypothetical protein [Candidatus Dojkabacteria bacterium]